MNTDKLNQLCSLLHARNQFNAKRRKALLRGYAIQAGIRYANWKLRDNILQKDTFSEKEFRVLTRFSSQMGMVGVIFDRAGGDYPNFTYKFVNEEALVRFTKVHCDREPQKRYANKTMKQLITMMKIATIERLSAELERSNFTQVTARIAKTLYKELGLHPKMDANNMYVALRKMNPDNVMWDYIVEGKEQITERALQASVHKMLAE